MRDNFEADWLRSEGAKRLSDNVGMAKICRSYHIKTHDRYLFKYVV